MGTQNVGDLIGKSVGDATIDPSGAAKRNDKLMSPNAKDMPEALNDTNEQKSFKGGSGKPAPPYGPRGHNF